LKEQHFFGGALFMAVKSEPRSKRQTGTRAKSSGGSRSRRSMAPKSRGGSRTTSRRGPAAKSSGKRQPSAHATQDLDEIREWAEERGGKPATVKSTAKGGEAGILRIDFPGYSGADSLEEISWDDWYQKFQENNLTFIYQDRTKDGKESRFFKLVCDPK
jgi:hypothetical protein